ncbi:MAG: hypothetical protein N3J91_15560 [Verrucomicrobiae bacterium]|nr:hypothetical protein [Verrucomicrobiae bacterium]
MAACLMTGWAAQNTNAIRQPYCLATNLAFPTLSPDGRQIACFVPRPTPRIEIWDLEGTTNRVLVEEAQRPAWSPDGRWIAFQQTRMVPGLTSQYGFTRINETMVMAPQGGRPRFVYPGASPHWSADGQRLFVLDEDNGQIVACFVDKPEDEPPVWWKLNKTPVARIAPDGRKVVVLTNDSLAVLSREKQELEFLIPIGNVRSLDFTWSPDSQALLVTVGNTGNQEDTAAAWWVDLQAQKLHCLSKGVWQSSAVSPKTGTVVLTRVRSPSTWLWVFPPEWVEARKAGRVPPFEPPPPPVD